MKPHQVQTLEARVIFNSDGFVDLIDNLYFPLIPGTTYFYRGTDEDGVSIRNRVTVTSQKKQIMGVTTTVVRDQVFEDGELVEQTLDWYAQDTAGNVWYFGEDSKDFENGVVVSTEGSWEAGVNGAEPGIIMRAQPGIGDEYRQELAPGIAEDQARVVAFNRRAGTPFAKFGDTLKTEEFTPLEPDVLEHKFYAPGIGFVKSQGVRGGSEVLRLASVSLAPEAFDTVIDNPYLPMAPGTTYIYRGTNKDGTALRNRVNVTHDTRLVMGVTTIVVRDREYEDGDLVEDTLDFFAQDKAGNVWYFGEQSREIEDGQVVSTEGSWEAGVNGAKPGILMRARPGIGDQYQQESAPGIAEDGARVLSLRARARTPFATFGRALKTEEFNPLEPGALEHKFYAPGIGFVKSQEVKGDGEVMRLAHIVFSGQA
jgi:hypothetical protein